MINETNLVEQELFNPNEYTEKELLKLLYRDFHRFEENFNDFQKSNFSLEKRTSSIENHITIEKEIKEEQEKKLDKRTKILVASFTAIVGVIEFVFKFIVK